MKSFQEIYDVVYQKAKAEVDIMVAKNKKNNLISLVISILVAVFVYICLKDFIIFNATILIILSIFIIFVCYLIVSGILNSGYGKKFKDVIIKPMVNEIGHNLSYDPVSGEPEILYKNSGLHIPSFDEYHSEDQIYGELEDGTYLEFSEVVTKKTEHYTDSEGHTRERTVETFRGMFGKIELKSEVFDTISIEPNSSFSTYSSSRVEMESAKFEKVYDVFSNDRVKAMQIFTSELIEKYSNFVKATGNRIELVIAEKDIYFKVPCGSMFEPPVWSNPLDERTLKRNYSMIFYPIDLLSATVEAVERVYEKI